MYRTASENAEQANCLRCGRPLTSAASKAAGYGPTCRAKVRAAQAVADLAGFRPEQIAAATELIEDGGVLPLRGHRIYLVVSSDGSAVHRTAVAGQCSCPAGLKFRRCWHTAAARIFAAAA